MVRWLRPLALHTVDEVGGDVENAHLDQFVERGVVAQGANLFDFFRIDTVHTQGYQFAGIGSG